MQGQASRSSLTARHRPLQPLQSCPPELRGLWGWAVSPRTVLPATEGRRPRARDRLPGPAPDGEQSAGSQSRQERPFHLATAVRRREVCQAHRLVRAENTSEGNGSGVLPRHRSCRQLLFPFGCCPIMRNPFEKARESLGLPNGYFRHSAVFLDFSLLG